MRTYVRCGVLATLVLGTLFASAAAPGTAQPGRAERLDIDACPGLAGQPQRRRELIAELLRIPSIARPAGTPAVLNQTDFVRIRRRNADPHRVDAILIQAIPNGASSITELGAQIVEMAARKGKNFEIWGIERREKNMEDLAGMRAAYARRDPAVALRYYYGSSYTDANGTFNGTLGGPGSSFVPLGQNDVPFLADWSADVMFGDIESMLDLVPKAQRHTHIFAYSASPGGGFLSQLAGVKLHDGNRGYQELGGLIAIEGQLSRRSIGPDLAPSPADVDKHVADVQAIRAGTTPRFLNGDLRVLSPGPIGAIVASIATMAAEFQPTRESIFPIGTGASGGTVADAFNAKLRLTNRARIAYSIADDPIPGSFTASYFLSAFGGRMGHLDFRPQPGTPVCAEPGPLGMQPPCVPPVAQIDANRVYDWISGGSGQPGLRASAFEGWTKNPQGQFDGSNVNGGPDNTNMTTAIAALALPATHQPRAVDDRVSHRDPDHRRELRRRLGLVFQQPLSWDRHPVHQPLPQGARRPAGSRDPSRLRQDRRRHTGHRVHRARRHDQSVRRQGLHRNRTGRDRRRDAARREAQPDRPVDLAAPLQEHRRPPRRQPEPDLRHRRRLGRRAFGDGYGGAAGFPDARQLRPLAAAPALGRSRRKWSVEANAISVIATNAT